MEHDPLPIELYQTIFVAAADPILLVNATGEIVLANDAVERVFGYRAAELIGQCIEVLVPGPMRAAHASHRASYERDAQPRAMGSKLDLVAVRRDGSVMPVNVSLSPVTLPIGRFVICIARDVRERRELEKQLRELGHRDAVTGLYSRTFLEQEIERLDLSDQFPLTCFVFDIDAMKEVNDTLGHPEGDSLLRRCANLLRRCFRTEDIIARIGGDEFAVLVTRMAEPGAKEAGARITQLLDADDPSNLRQTVRMSFGWATAARPPVRDVLAVADRNMYTAKGHRIGQRLGK